MERVLIAAFVLAFIEAMFAWIDDLFYSLYDWLDGAVIEIDESDLIDYMDNSEYDWGHNVKGYHYEN